MNIKYLFLICCVVGQVKCDCDGYMKCLGEFVQDFFNNLNVINDKITNTTNSNSTISEPEKSVKDTTVSYFDLTDIGKSLDDALSDVTKLIKTELEGMFDLKHETDIREIDNKTQIHIKAYSIDKRHWNDTIKIPEIITNNLTEFNNELNALKVELENNLQAEIEDFIAKILENDTVDWEEVTDDPYSNNSETTIVTPNNDTEIINRDTPTTKLPNEVSSDTITTKTKSTEESKVESLTDTYNISTTTVPVKVSSENAKEVSATTTSNLIKLDNITTTTTESSTSSNVLTTTTTKIEEIILQDKFETQTKASIDFKLIENVQENEISKDEDIDYQIEDDNNTDYPIIDYIDLYKDTTNEDVEYKPTEVPTVDIDTKTDLDNTIEKGDELTNGQIDNAYTNDTTNPASIFPWIATIFIRNETTNLFDYYCDGVLVTNKVVVTAGRCIHRPNKTVIADDILVILGKRSLQLTQDVEKVFKVNLVNLHENFTLEENRVENDLASLRLEDPAVYSDAIRPACILSEEEGDEAVSTAWDIGITLVKFEGNNKICEKNPSERTFCATFGNNVPLCPSYGGAYAVKQADSWCLRGIRTADPTYRGFCIEKTVTYTDLTKFKEWLDKVILTNQ